MFCFWFLITNQWLVIHHPCSTVFAFGLTIFCNNMDRVQFWFPLHINLFVCTLSLKRFVGSSLPAKDLSRLTECYKKWTRQNLFWFGGNRGGWGEHWGGLGGWTGLNRLDTKIWIHPGIGRACAYILKAKKFAEPLFQSKKFAEKVRKSGRPFWAILGHFWAILGHS